MAHASGVRFHPVGLVHRACDSFVACNDAQSSAFNLDPGYAVKPWMAVLAGEMGDTNVVELLLDNDGNVALACTGPVLCTELAGTLNHLRWPDGIDDGGGHDREPAILTFLRDHPFS